MIAPRWRSNPILGRVVTLIALGCGPAHSAPLPPAERFGVAANLGAGVNTSGFDGGPSLAADGLSLYLASGRPGGFGGADLWIAGRTSVSGPFGPPTNLGGSVNSVANESAPDLSADMLVLVFDSDRPGGLGSYDLWITTRATPREAFSAPRNLGDGVNSSASDGHPHLSADGLRLYFQSRRSGGFGEPIFGWPVGFVCRMRSMQSSTSGRG